MSLFKLPPEYKIRYAMVKIQEFYEQYNGNVYIAYSGGKDSEVLRWLVNYMYPDVPSVFCDTGLEFREIREHVFKSPVVCLKPTKRFDIILNEYGYPVISKEVSMAISRYRNTKSDVQKQLRLEGGVNPSSGKKQTTGVIPKKWQYMIHAPFKISEQCCYFMKKQPFEKYEKLTGRKPYIGTMASDSNMRLRDYKKFGCNAFDKKKPQSRPLSIFNTDDIWWCIKNYNIPYSKIYNMGYARTGCMFCMYGCHMEERNRFDLMKITHPSEYKYCMNNLGCREVIEWTDLCNKLIALDK